MTSYQAQFNIYSFIFLKPSSTQAGMIDFMQYCQINVIILNILV